MTFRLAAVLLVSLSLCACVRETPPAADMIFVNGAVFTADDAAPSAEAAAIRGDEIIFVGGREGAMAHAGEATEIVDMKGGMLLPGFTDAHVHLVDGGQTLTSLAVYDAESAEEVVAMVGDYAAAHPELDVIYGSGWALPHFPNGNPHKSLLDSVEEKRPVILYSADGHNLWGNSAALAAAGVTATTPDPANGRIERDASGEPSGTLRESAAQLMDTLIPKMTAESALRDLLTAMKFQNAMGYTASIDASVPPGPMEDAFIAAVENGEASLRVTLSLLPTTDFTDKAFAADQIGARIEELEARRAKIGAADPEFLTGGMVKIFLDGVLENQTGALIEPYIGLDDAEERGVLNMAPALLREYAIALDRAGFDMHMHAIGDLAVRSGLDAIAAAKKENPARERHHHLAHIELIDPADISRFAETGAAANMQTLWAYADSYITDLTEPYLGESRSRWLYPNGALRDAGAELVSGSDWPVSTSDPFDAIEVAVTRMAPDGESREWLPEQRLAVVDMLNALTINGARLMGQEQWRGSIEVGKRADLVLVGVNLFDVEPAAISETAVIMTLLDGKPVYARSAGADETP